MSTMKNFLKYIIVILLVYIFSNIMINTLFKVSYTEITNYNINFEKPFLEITEAKASKRNGEIYGIIKNNTDKVIENKFIKFSILSKNGNVLGEKYVKIEKLEVNQLRKFEIKFNYDNVKTFKVEIVDNKPEEIDFIELIKQNANDLISGRLS